MMIDIVELDGYEADPSLVYGGRAGVKRGIVIDGAWWMVKYPRNTRDMRGKHLPAYNTSPLSEWVGSHIYASLGIPVHETMLGYRDGKIVCACRDFTFPDKTLLEFKQLRTALDDDDESYYDYPSDGEGLVLSDVIASISPVMRPRGVTGGIDRFWEMFVVDAFIKNDDRNSGNWGLLLNKEARTFELAPVYDNGSCLFNKRTESLTKARIDDPKAFAEDAFTNVLSCYQTVDEDGDRHRIKPFEFLRASEDRSVLGAMHRVVPRIDMGEIEAILRSVPQNAYGQDVLPAAVRDAHCKILRARYEDGLVPIYRELCEKLGEDPRLP